MIRAVTLYVDQTCAPNPDRDDQNQTLSYAMLFFESRDNKAR
jgi:hypothetical protein